MSACGLAHLYTDAVCLLPAGHDREPAGEVHKDRGTHWIHHEQEIATDGVGVVRYYEAGAVVYDVWDERV